MTYHNATLSSVLPSIGSLCVRVNPQAKAARAQEAAKQAEPAVSDVVEKTEELPVVQVAAAEPAVASVTADTSAGSEPETKEEQLIEKSEEPKAKKTTSRRKKAAAKA